MEAGLDIDVASTDWTNAVVQATNLSELHLALGEIERAIVVARRNEGHPRRSGYESRWAMLLATLADALHQAGETGEAEPLFREAERMVRKIWGQYRELHSVPGYQYCGLLLAEGKRDEVRRRAAETIQIAERNRWLLSIALDHLSLGRAHPPESEEAREHLDLAVDGLREAGTLHHVPRGLLARAALRRERRKFADAQRDLDEVHSIATRCGMRLFETDYHLESARLRVAEGDDDKAREHLTKAKALVEETGYHRRDGEVAELGKALG